MAFVLRLLCLLVLTACDFGTTLPKRHSFIHLQFFKPEQSWRHSPQHFIAHAGGAIEGHRYTNSREAVEQSLRNGFVFIELDIVETTDGHLVAAHGWEDFRTFTGREGKGALSLAEFKDSKIFGRFTPLTMEDIVEIFRAHPAAVLVTDKIRDHAKLLAAFPFHERLIVEVFGTADYLAARAHNSRFIPMLSTGLSEKDHKFIIQNEVRIVAFNTARLRSDRRKYAEDLHARGITSFVFTTDEASFMEEHLGRSASAFYVDAWSPLAGKCLAKDEECRTQF